MRFARTYVLAFLSLLLAFPALPQQTTSPPKSDAQALALVAKAMTALTGGQTVSDVTLNGNVTSIVGPDTETGTGTFMAKGTAESRVDLNLASGLRTGIRNDTAGFPQGASLAGDGSLQPWPLHNCWISASWFFPALSVLASASDPSVVFTYVGLETRNGTSVQHIRFFRYISDKNPYVIALTQRLSTTDVYLDSASSLPVAIIFDFHLENDDGTNITTEIDFSSYQSVNAVQVPFRIQKLLFSGLVLDVAVTKVTFNSGLSNSPFAVQ